MNRIFKVIIAASHTERQSDIRQIIENSGLRILEENVGDIVFIATIDSAKALRYFCSKFANVIIADGTGCWYSLDDLYNEE